MNSLQPTIWQNYIRRIGVFGVLLGLFFSGGEGIRLLPYSAAEVVQPKNAAAGIENNLQSYSFSVHNPAHNFSGTKAQKLFSRSVFDGWSTFSQSNVRTDPCLLPAIYQAANRFPSAVFLASLSDRAPPMLI